VVLLDEAASTLEDAEMRDLYRVLSEWLPKAIVISIGRSAVLADLHHRTAEMNGANAPSHARHPANLAPAPA
jgi:ABC-type uncharacterized transport system fused permease/ATPase subunit